MNYQAHILKVIDYIGQHLDEPLSLDELSRVSCLSKFHFHRLFTAFMGLSLQQYIKWLRLKRAAYQLHVDKDQSIINIAMNAGFESHEAFTRAFKTACGMSPSEFRQHPSWAFWEKSPYILPVSRDVTMKVEIRNIEKIRLAVIEHRGDPNQLMKSVEKLIGWAKAQPISVKPKAGDAFGFAYDDPKTTPPEEFRHDLAIKIPENLKVTGDAIERYLPAGRYAVAMHKGSRNKIAETVYSMYREWLPTSNEQLGDLPCIFCYYNFDHEVAETEALTECWLLLK